MTVGWPKHELSGSTDIAGPQNASPYTITITITFIKGPSLSAKPSILVASPFETEYVDRMRAVVGDRANIIHALDLLPTAMYLADHDGPEDFVRTLADQKRWLDLLASADVLFGTPREAKSDILALCPNLKWMQGTSAGMGKAAERFGLVGTDVILTSASGTHAGPLAEFVFAALLNWSRHLQQLRSWQQDHHWQRFTASELAGKTMVLVGPGRIGRKIIATAKTFDMHVIAVGRERNPDRASALGSDSYVSVDQLSDVLPVADVVVIAAPHTGETDHLIGKPEFALLKSGVWFINIGRGAIVDEPELIRRLASGQIAHAALDVFAVEPLPIDSPLWDMENVIVSPHCSANAPRENERITDIFIQNLPLFLDGKFDQMSPRIDYRRLY